MALTAGQIRQVNERLEEKGKRGLKANNAAIQEIAKMPEQEKDDLLLWFSTDDGDADLMALHAASDSPKSSGYELARITRNFKTRRPLEKHLPGLSETDAYLRERRRDIKDGLRRR